MAGHGQFASTAQTEAVHRGDDRLPHRLELPEDLLPRDRAFLAPLRILAGELADVGTRNEGLWARAGQQHPTDARIRGNRPGGLAQLPDDLVIQGIELVRTVDGEHSETVALFIE